MPSSNLPRHGDSIIDRVNTTLGEKLIANRQFQEFLDELGTLVDSTPTDINDVFQLVESNSAEFSSQIANILDRFEKISFPEQEIYVNQSTIDSMMSVVQKSIKSIESNNQLILAQNAAIDTLDSRYSKILKKVEDLEQEINGN